MDDNSFYGAPAGWYPDPLGLPQLRWWDSTAWTHQTTEARAPMVMQETTYAWPEDEREVDQDQELPTRRERREQERRDGTDTPPPTAFTLLQLEPPSVADLPTNVPEPSPFSGFAPLQDSSAHQASGTQQTSGTQQAFVSDDTEIPNPMAASRAASLQDPSAEAFAGASYEEAAPTTSSAEQVAPGDYPPQGAAAASGFAPSGFDDGDFDAPATERTNFDWRQQEASPLPASSLHPSPHQASEHQASEESFHHGRNTRRQTAMPDPGLHRSTNNGAVWMIALVPLLQLVLSLLILTAFGTAEASGIMAAIWIAPYPIVVGLAAIDRARLRRSGHQHPAHWLWALLTAPVYLVVRAVASIRESGGGFGPVLVWFALGLLQIGSIVAVPGLLISTIPAVFSHQAEQSIAFDASVIGSTIEVTCPTTPPVLIGQKFDCTGLQPSGKTLDIQVSLQRVNGWVTWRVDDWGIYTIG